MKSELIAIFIVGNELNVYYYNYQIRKGILCIIQTFNIDSFLII